MLMGTVLSENGSYPQKMDKPVHKNMSACEIMFLNVVKWRFQIYKIAQYTVCITTCIGK